MMSTSFVQFRYCPLCRTSHKQKKKKHIYSSRHQTVLQNVLTKFSKKISEGRAAMSPPLVQPHGWEVDAEFWCYFCQREVKKHKEQENCTLVCGGLIEHASSKEHNQKMAEFFWENIIPVSRKPEFVITNEDYNRYLVQSVQAVADYQAKLKERIAQEAARIWEAGRRRQFVTWMGMREQHVKQTYGSVEGVSKKKPGDAGQSLQGAADPAELRGKWTVAAYGEGLTCIIRPEEDGDESVGNVFTGATPPWLLDEADDGSGEIGPTMEEFRKHLEREKKRKLPAGRVGAKFNHKAETAAEWLPSFGRVWNHGRRLNSHRQFLKEKRAAPATITSADLQGGRSLDSSQPSPATVCVPYKRKKGANPGTDIPHDTFPGFVEASVTETSRMNDASCTITNGSSGLSADMYSPVWQGETGSYTQTPYSGQFYDVAHGFVPDGGYSNQRSYQSHNQKPFTRTDTSLMPPANIFSEDGVGIPSEQSRTVSKFNASVPMEEYEGFVPVSGRSVDVNPYVMPYQRRRQPQNSDGLNSSGVSLATKLLSTPVLLKQKYHK